MTREETNIDLLMKRNGVKTQIQLSEILGVHKQTVSRMLTGDITTKTIKMIADAFNVSEKEVMIPEPKMVKYAETYTCEKCGHTKVTRNDV